MSKVIIDIGHSASQQGAVGEYDYNVILAQLISEKLSNRGVKNIVVNRGNNGLSRHIIDINNMSDAGDLVLSLHCNAFDGLVSGSETWYYGHPDLAKQIQESIIKSLCLPNRGIKKVTRKDRAYSFVYGVRERAILIEPFFIDNVFDRNVGMQYRDGLAEGIADVLAKSV